MITISLYTFLGSFLLVDLATSFAPILKSSGWVSQRRSLRKNGMSMALSLGGKLVVSGIGSVEEDEFALSLLNEQKSWDSIVLTTDDVMSTKKRFLSRTARYSGLLNVLDFVSANPVDDSMKSALNGATAWLAFGVDQKNVVKLAELAVDAGLKRTVFTIELSPESVNETAFPEFNQAQEAFSRAGIIFTMIRHGEVIAGDEDNAYDIVNASLPCSGPVVQRGVLARVAAELLLSDKAVDSVCGLSTAGDFALAYLNILRSSGLTRRQEVEKMFSGGLQRVSELTIAEYDNRKKKEEEKQLLIQRRKREEATEELLGAGSEDDEEFDIGLREEDIEIETPESIVAKRTEEILATVWAAYDSRMYTKTTSKVEFFASNREKAAALAAQEYEDSQDRKRQIALEKEAKDKVLERFVDANRKQYTKLMNLEKKELTNQKEISDTWVKYIYLLLEFTMDACQQAGTLFHNMDEYSQTLMLRKQANALRSQCNIPPYEVVYDPLDAAEIVSKLASQPIGQRLGLASPADDLIVALESKYKALLKNVAALRGAAQIIELAIETLKREIPPAPPSAADLRQADSEAKQLMVAKMRAEAQKSRRKPRGTLGDGDMPSVVGTMM